ncbi:MAG: hypothetical protein JWO38_5341 [Gemmataceae bacterium]|nr:hypothetical protein [Gemmataceae bacterium]
MGNSKPFKPTLLFQKTFPQLTGLLCRARLLEVRLDEQPYFLFSWGQPPDQVRAWLSPPPSAEPPASAAPEHGVLLGSFGGIVERYNEPAGNCLLNHNEALTAGEVVKDASFMVAYGWAFEECGGIPIETASYYPAAWEANGNCVLCERATGRLLFFAPDHADKNLIPFESCPMYTLHVHRQVTTFREWVEHIAGQWLKSLG